MRFFQFLKEWCFVFQSCTWFNAFVYAFVCLWNDIKDCDCAFRSYFFTTQGDDFLFTLKGLVLWWKCEDNLGCKLFVGFCIMTPILGDDVYLVCILDVKIQSTSCMKSIFVIT